MKEKLLISSCLLGNNCKYNAKNNYLKETQLLKSKYDLIKVCPELMANLGVPRKPCEIKDGKVFNIDNLDITKNFEVTNEKLLYFVRKYNIKKALLKEGSPSCGVYRIKDGSFTSTDIAGNGMATRLLKECNVTIFSDEELEKLL